MHVQGDHIKKKEKIRKKQNYDTRASEAITNFSKFPRQGHFSGPFLTKEHDKLCFCITTYCFFQRGKGTTVPSFVFLGLSLWRV